MAFSGEIDVEAPWRNTDVQVFTHSAVAEQAQHGQPPIPEHSPVVTIAVANEGRLVFETVRSYVVVGEGDWAIRFTAVEGGADGDDITVTYVDPAGNTEPLAVSVVGTDIEVSLETDGAGALISTGEEILTALLAETDVTDIATPSAEGDSDGTGVAEAVSETALAGGSDGLADGAYFAVAQDPDAEWRYVGFSVTS